MRKSCCFFQVLAASGHQITARLHFFSPFTSCVSLSFENSPFSCAHPSHCMSDLLHPGTLFCSPDFCVHSDFFVEDILFAFPGAYDLDISFVESRSHVTYYTYDPKWKTTRFSFIMKGYEIKSSISL